MADSYLQIPTLARVHIDAKRVVLSVCAVSESTESKVMAHNVVKACGLDPEEASHLLELDEATSFHTALAESQVRYVLVYGLSPKQVGLQWSVQPYTWIKDGARLWCFAERLTLINNDLQRKRRLWSCMKRIAEERE